MLNHQRIFFASIFMIASSVITACNSHREQIAFVTNRDEKTNLEIYLMNADGSNPINLTNNSMNDFAPAWSPDGNRIAFVSDRDGNYEIYIMDADGSNQQRLTSNSDGDFAPVWTPDGKHIVFTSDRDGIACLPRDEFTTSEIYLMNVDGSDQTRITENFDWDYELDWSISKEIVILSDQFCSGKGFTNTQLYLLSSDGTTRTLLTSLSETDTDPMWSHDGQRIVFSSIRDGNSPEIYVMNADGTDQTRLTYELPQSSFNVMPAWSKDDSRIVFSSARDGNSEIYVMNSDGTEQTRLTFNPESEEVYPVWRP